MVPRSLTRTCFGKPPEVLELPGFWLDSPSCVADFTFVNKSGVDNIINYGIYYFIINYNYVIIMFIKNL